MLRIGLVAVLLSGCFAQIGGLDARVGRRAVSPQVPARRISSSEPLRIVLTKNVADAFTVDSAPTVHTHVTGFRASVGGALDKTFRANFRHVEIKDAETGRGLELVVNQASLQPSHTLKYNVLLLREGKELLDVVGESQGKTVMLAGSAFDANSRYTRAVEELVDYSLGSACEGIYNAVMRDKTLEEQGFYASLETQGAAAPVLPQGSSPTSPSETDHSPGPATGSPP